MKHIISILLLLVIFFVQNKVDAETLNEESENTLNNIKAFFDLNPELKAEYERFHALEPKREMFVPVFRYHTKMVKMKIVERGKPTRYEMVEVKYYTIEDKMHNDNLVRKAESRFIQYYELWEKYFSTEEKYYKFSRKKIVRAIALLRSFEDDIKDDGIILVE